MIRSPEGCTDYVEITEAGSGYCVMGVLPSAVEVFVAGHLLQGEIPSDEWILELVADAADPLRAVGG